MEGKEEAHRLGRVGSSAVNSLPILKGLSHKALRDCVWSEHKIQWESYGEDPTRSASFWVLDEKWVREMLRMNVRKVVEALTGHYGLSSHLTSECLELFFLRLAKTLAIR